MRVSTFLPPKWAGLRPKLKPCAAEFRAHLLLWGHMSEHHSKRKRYALDVEAWIQFKLLRLAALHTETTKADLAVLAEVIQQYKGWSGNGFVSDQQICALAGLSVRTVIRSRKNLTRLGFVQVVRAGGRGHATVYTPNFGLVPQKGDTDVTNIKGDIAVTETDKNVTLNAVYGDMDVTPSYPESGSLTGPQKDRRDSAPASPPAGTAAGNLSSRSSAMWIRGPSPSRCWIDGMGASRPLRVLVRLAVR